MAINIIKINEFPESVDTKNWMVVADANGVSYKISIENVKAELGIGALMQYRGSVVPTSPVQPAGDFFVTATQNGTYTNYGGVVVPANSFAVISRVGGVYTSSITELDTNTVQKTDIVNNLIEGGIDKVLSAEMGVALNESIEKIAYEEPVLTKIAESQPASESTFTSQTSQFSGWASFVGVFNNFQAVSIRIKPFDAAFLPTKVRVLIRTAANGGTILADSTVDITSEYNVEQTVPVIFSNIITNPTNADLWVEYRTDGRIGLFSKNMGTGVDRKVYYTNSRNINAGMTAVSSAASQQMFVVFYTVEPKLKFSEEAEEAIREIADVGSVDIVIPSRIYGVVGVETNIYFENILDTTIPIKDLDINFSGIGQILHNRLRIVPTTESTTTINIVISYRGQEVASKTITFYAVEKSKWSGITRRVNLWGDSTTAGGEVFSIINSELLVGDPMTMQFVGSLGTGNAKREGYAGWSIYSFTQPSQGGVANPLWNVATSQLSYANYLSVNSITMSTGDWAAIHVGINSVTNIQNDTDMNIQIPLAATQLRQIVTAFKAVSGIRVAVCIPIPPCISQDAFGDDYNRTIRLQRYIRNMRALQKALIAEFDSDDNRSNGIYAVPFSVILDRENGFPFSTVNANSRSTNQVRFYTNAVHPIQSGYNQMGDALYSFVKVIG